jgi:hypothetical protein
MAKEQRVPPAQLGGLADPLREGHIEAIPHRRARVPDESPQALGMCGIAERRPSWICPHNQFQTEHTGDARGIDDREPIELGPFEPTDLCGGHVHRATERGLTEAGADPCLAGFVTELSEAPLPPPGSSIECPFDRSHRLSVKPASPPPLTGRLLQALRPANDRDEARLRFARFG